MMSKTKALEVEEHKLTASTLLDLEAKETYFKDLLSAPNGYFERIRVALDKKMCLLVLMTELVDSMSEDGPWGIDSLKDPLMRVKQQIIAQVYHRVKENPYTTAIWSLELVQALIHASPTLFVLNSDDHHPSAERWQFLYNKLVEEIYELNLRGAAYARYYFFLIEQLRKVESAQPVDTGESTPEFKDKLEHKAQILLLKDLGFFELEKVDNLLPRQKALLVSALLNRDEANTHNYIQYGLYKPTGDKYDCSRKRYKTKVNELYQQVGVDPIK